jgi:hypothetical protein
MTRRRRLGLDRASRTQSLLVSLVIIALTIAAQSRAAARPPTLNGLFPPGAARGETLTVTATGSFDRWPVKGWADGPGLNIQAEAEKGKLSVQVAADAEPGVRMLRLYDEEGATGLRPFVIGVLPERVETEPNDDPMHPQIIPPPSATVNGRLNRSGDVDGFSIRLSAGQTLVADLEANRSLGSPMDAVLQIVSPSGFVLAQNDDTVGRDPRIVFEVPTDGTYLVRVFAFPATPDSSIRFAGGEAYVYRLTMTTAGFLDHAFPLAIYRDLRGSVAAMGFSIPPPARWLRVTLGDDGRDVVHAFHPLLAGTTEVRCVSTQTQTETEPDTPTTPQEVPNQVAISGRIDVPGDRDAFRLKLGKGEKRIVRVASRSLGLALDPVLRLYDAAGTILAESDDVGSRRDPELSFTAPADGEYRLVVRDLNGRGGPRCAYLLQAVAPEPDFDLVLSADRFDVTRGGAVKLSVTVNRREGFSAPIEILAEHLPEGLASSPVASKANGPSAKSVTLEVSADVHAHSGPFLVVGKSVQGGVKRRVARAPISGSEQKTDRPWFTSHPAARQARK